MLTGHNPSEPPYELYPIRHWNPNLSGGLEKIIQKCTQLNPDDRFQSCAELLYALNHYEEADDEYRLKQKRKLRNFAIVTGTALFFLGVGIFGQAMKNRTDNLDYNNHIQWAEKAAAYEEKVKHYLTAIDIKPTVNDAYFGLIETFKSDTVFTVEEEEQLKKKWRPVLQM